MTTTQELVWKQSNGRQAHQRGQITRCVIGRSNCLLSVGECSNGQWHWSVAVDGVVGDRDCQISDGMRRDWLSGRAKSEWDAKRAAEAAQYRTPATFMPIDVGFDPRSIGQAVVVSPDEDAGDAVGYYRWAGKDGQPRELLANVWSVAAEMRKAGYKVKVETSGRSV